MSYYYSWELDSIDRESIFDTPETQEDFYELKEEGGEYYDDELTQEEIDDLIAQGYV